MDGFNIKENRNAIRIRGTSSISTSCLSLLVLNVAENI